MSRPIILQKRGSKWEVYLNVPSALHWTKKKDRLKSFPADALVPVCKKDAKSVGLVVGGKPARLTKEEAKSFAHQIGRYMLDLGDFAYTYTEERTEAAPETSGDRARRRRSRRTSFSRAARRRRADRG